MKEMNKLLQKWENMTSAVLDLKPIQPEEIQTNLKETYFILTKYNNNSIIPKTLAKVLLEMTDFVAFADLIEQNENLENCYCAFSVCVIASALKRNFFNDDFACFYPELALKTPKNETIIFNLETDNIKNLHL